MHSDAPAKGDRIGQLGGYKRGAFKCKDGSIPSSAKGATNRDNLYYYISILPSFLLPPSSFLSSAKGVTNGRYSPDLLTYIIKRSLPYDNLLTPLNTY